MANGSRARKTARDAEIEKLKQELENLKKKYKEKCQQLDKLQNEDLLLRKIQELLTLQAEYQRQIQTLQKEKQQLELQVQQYQQQKQTLLQTVWQEALQVMEEDYQLSQQRIQELEQRVAELQEQIIAQAKQKHEYETALQYLQEQALHFHNYALRLSQAIDRLLEEQREWQKAALPPRVDLPSFLVKNRP
ncbi:MAG: hypothetical protein ACK421_00090 [Pseudanabaenaceae cyanobacterium]